jgi:KipI family sensor histidine kinase inhibitor
VTLLPCGPLAVLVECGTHAATELADVLRCVDGVRQVVPAATTVLVEHDGRADIEASIASAIAAHVEQPAAGIRSRGDVVEIAVRYDGCDLADVADTCGLSVAEVVALHTGSELTSAFCGFSPGFAYLTGLPEPLASLPRRVSPRTRVPAGAVAIAGGYSAVYPSASPGGWHLIGQTDTVLWDPTSDMPALLSPGTAVRFSQVRP